MTALSPWGEGFIAGLVVGVLVVFGLLFVASLLVHAVLESGVDDE